jgi:hypothetical protein
MSMPSFEVTSYKVQLSRKIGVGLAAQIQCMGDDNQSLFISFMPSDEALPNNFSDVELKTGAIFRPSSEYAWYLDLLRNEGPIYAHLIPEDPDGNSLSTWFEPIGTGDI